MPAFDRSELDEMVQRWLAGYKVPARVVFVPEVVRSRIGKADYHWAGEVLARA